MLRLRSCDVAFLKLQNRYTWYHSNQQRHNTTTIAGHRIQILEHFSPRSPDTRNAGKQWAVQNATVEGGRQEIAKTESENRCM
jgi:hypothetical protein